MIINHELLADGILKVTLDGSLDLAGSQILADFFETLPENAERIVVDLGAVDYLGSPGIRVLVQAAKALHASGCKLIAVNVGEPARRVMWTTGLDTIVPVADDEKAAMRSVA